MLEAQQREVQAGDQIANALVPCDQCRCTPIKILAISSGGGHWVQLLRLRPALDSCSVTFATVNECYRGDVANYRFKAVTDATRWNKVAMVKMACEVALLLLREKPDVILSTGAAPGYVAIRLGKLMGARTIWIDSMANAETLSMSGEKAGKHADLWLTQWPHLARPEGPHFMGAVI